MPRLVAALAAALLWIAPLAAEGAVKGIDAVLMVDLSGSMAQGFKETMDEALATLFSGYLRYGDRLHVFGFTDSVALESVQDILDEPSLRKALASAYLLYPLGKYSDLIASLEQLAQYLIALPEGRAKTVVLVTDGFQHAPPSSPYASLDDDAAAARLSALVASIRQKGWTLHIVAPKPGTLPASVESAEEGPASRSHLETLSRAAGDAAEPSQTGAAGGPAEGGGSPASQAGLGLLSIDYPEDLGKVDYGFELRLGVSNPGGTEAYIELTRLLIDGGDALTEKSFLSLSPGASGSITARLELPPETLPGRMTVEIEPVFSGSLRASPRSSSAVLELSPNPIGGFFRASGRVALFAFLLAILLALSTWAFFLWKRVPRRVAEPIVEAVLKNAEAKSRAKAAHETGSPAQAPSTGTRLPLREEGQVAASLEAGFDRGKPTPEPLPTPSRTSEPSVPEDRAGPPLLHGASRESPSPKAVSAEAIVKIEGGGSASLPLKKAPSPASSPSGRFDLFGKPLAEEALRASESDVAETRAMRERLEAESRGDERIVASGPIEVELRVSGQNPNVGRRNVRTMAPGSKATVGGGRSDFLVFLLPLPARLALVRFDGEKLSFLPLAPEYFPSLRGRLDDCLDRAVPLVARGGKALELRFSRFTPPGERINRLLHCIDAPGLFEDR